MSLDDDTQALKNIALFRKVEPAKLKLLAFTSERLRFVAGEALFSEGDVGDAAYIILAGDAVVEVATDGGSVEVARVGANDIVGEIAILCEVPRTATVRAVSELVTLKVSKEGFFHLVTQFPQIGIEIMAELAARLHHTTQALTAARAQLDTGTGI